MSLSGFLPGQRLANQPGVLRENLVVRKRMSRRPYRLALMAGNHVNVHVEDDLAGGGAVAQRDQNSVRPERFP